MIKTNKDELLIGLISDTHVPDRTTMISDTIINDLKKKKIDYLFHLGDFSNFETFKSIISIFGKDKVIGVRGNTDLDGKLKEILPEQLEFELYDRKIFMTHGTGGPNMILKRLCKRFDVFKYDILIFGHTHRPLNEKKNNTLFINPGTTTPIDNKFTVVSSYGFLKISQTKVEFTIKYL